MPGHAHLTADERDRLTDLKADGLSLRAIARALGRAASTISRELRRNALDSGAYRPQVADGAYMLRRQRAAVLETDTRLAGYVTARLSEGWTPAVRAEAMFELMVGAAWNLLTLRDAETRHRDGD